MQALQQVPDHLEALVLLLETKRKVEGVAMRPADGKHSAPHRARNSNLLWATTELAFMLFQRGERVECEVHARNAARLAPRNAQAHGIMGLILTETNRALASEYHFRKAIDIAGENTCTVNLANCLKTQGKVEESERGSPKPSRWAKCGSTPRLVPPRRSAPQRFPMPGDFFTRPGKPPQTVDLSLTRAILYGREKKNEEAVTELSRSGPKARRSNSAIALLERGRLYDKMDRYDDAWADYAEGKRLCREVQGRRYNEQIARDLVEQLKRFFTRQRMGILPRAHRDIDMPQPVFIIGYPRSGTTMVEQTITAHPKISAGDELVFINDLTRVGSRMLGSPLAYPECLADLWMGDNQLTLDQFVITICSAPNSSASGAGRQPFTDKMPLNETHLGLIHLVFQDHTTDHSCAAPSAGYPAFKFCQLPDPWLPSRHSM